MMCEALPLTLGTGVQDSWSRSQVHTSYQLEATSYKLQATSYQRYKLLQATSHKPQATGMAAAVPATGCQLQAKPRLTAEVFTENAVVLFHSGPPL